MDKLKAALVYKFWMLFGVTLLVPFIGWWMATSAISGQVEERVKKLDSAFSGLTASGENPNDKWTTQIKKYMGVQETAVLQAHQQLFEGQKDLLVWPSGLSWKSGAIPTESQITQRDIDYYRNLYDSLVEAVQQIPHPIDPETGVGLVDFPIAKLPHSDFSKFPPRRDEIIQTREDLWLYEALLRAIDNVNQRAEAKTQMEAPIRQIVKIELRGGKSRGASALGATGGAGGSAGAMSAAAGGSAGQTMAMPAIAMSGPAGGHGDGGMGRMMGSAGSGLGMGGGGGGVANVEFDASEEFGSDSEGFGGGGSSATMSAAPMASSPPGTAGGHGDAGRMGGGGSAGSKGRLYIEDNSKYKTRGFYLSVTMDHLKLPDLLVELSNSPWPIRVMRVQQADMHMQDLAVVGNSLGASAFSGTAAGGAAGFSLGGTPFSSPLNRGAALASAGGEGGAAGRSGVSAFDDPLLVQVALCGFITIYKPPPAPQSAGTSPSGATPAAPSADAPSTTTTAQPSAENAESQPAAATATQATSTPTDKSATPTGASTTEPDKDKEKSEPTPANNPKKEPSAPDESGPASPNPKPPSENSAEQPKTKPTPSDQK